MALLFSKNSSVQGMPSQQEDGRLSHGMMQRRLFPQLVKVIQKDSATCGSCVLISIDFLSPRMDKDKDEPLTGARDASFKHYCSCYPGGKPTYNLKLTKEAGTAGRFKDWFWRPSRPSTFSELC